MMAILPLALLLGLAEAKEPEPLMVVVEARAAEVVKVGALREAIGRELGARVLSPVEEPSTEGVAIMTVVLTPDKAVVTYRHGSLTVYRAIELPPDGRQRLQLVTWLAGNIVRDQTSDLLPNRKTAGSIEVAPPTAPALTAAPPPLPPTAAPQPIPPAWAAPQTPVARVTSPPPPVVGPTHEWTAAALIGHGAGISYDHIKCNCGGNFVSDSGGPSSEIEVTRSGPAFAIGGMYLKTQGHAWALTFGWHRRPVRWLTAEVRATVGMWFIDETNETDLLARLAGGLAVSPVSWLDVVARLSIVAPMRKNDFTTYASIGLRYRLPL